MGFLDKFFTPSIPPEIIKTTETLHRNLTTRLDTDLALLLKYGLEPPEELTPYSPNKAQSFEYLTITYPTFSIPPHRAYQFRELPDRECNYDSFEPRGFYFLTGTD